MTEFIVTESFSMNLDEVPYEDMISYKQNGSLSQEEYSALEEEYYEQKDKEEFYPEH